MVKGTKDRRIARTRGMLQHALLSLILKKDYEAITVEDICETANVGRSTFYSHYTSKDHLKRSGLDEHLRRLLIERQKDARTMPGNRGDRSLSFSLAMFEHASDHKDLYRALIGGRGGIVALGTIRKTLSNMVRGELAATAGKSDSKNTKGAVPPEIAVQFTVGAYMAVLIWWLDRGAKLPPQQIDALFRRLLTGSELRNNTIQDG